MMKNSKNYFDIILLIHSRHQTNNFSTQVQNCPLFIPPPLPNPPHQTLQRIPQPLNFHPFFCWTHHCPKQIGHIQTGNHPWLIPLKIWCTENNCIKALGNYPNCTGSSDSTSLILNLFKLYPQPADYIKRRHSAPPCLTRPGQGS